MRAFLLAILPTVLILAACGPPGTVPGDPDGGQDGGSDAGEPGPLPGQDLDEDGLDDAWEAAAGDPAVLDWRRSDTDDNGVPDGDEDPDGDGLTNAEEQALSVLVPAAPARGPHPLRIDLLVELDAMSACAPSEAVLASAVAAFAAAPLSSEAGGEGVGLQVYVDQLELPRRDLDDSAAGRQALLAGSGPTFTAAVPVEKMVHVILATRRSDDATRGGEVLMNAEGSLEKAGVLVYHDALFDLHPACGVDGDPKLPPVTFAEALATTLVHELGHALQLGHDSEAGGGVNYWNVMSVPSSCSEAQMRFHGYGNHDAFLGSTEAVMAPRFSVGAAALMRFDHILSVHTAALDDGGDGYEM